MTSGELTERVLKRVGEDHDAPVYYKPSEVLDALNAAQRLFCLLTLCLETSDTLALTGTTTFYNLLSSFSDFLLPLRVQVVDGDKVRPGHLASFDSLSDTWQADAGDPERYNVLGMDLLAITPRPASTSTSLTITYAQCPARMTGESDTPEIPTEYHPCLIDGAVVQLRAKEGGQEFQKVLPAWGNFLNEAVKMAEYVRGRMAGRGYDRAPFELDKWQNRQKSASKS